MSVEELIEAMPDPEKLEIIARYFDLEDLLENNPNSHEVQDDLRKWAAKIREVKSFNPVLSDLDADHHLPDDISFRKTV